jgi:hypothetical protein
MPQAPPPFYHSKHHSGASAVVQEAALRLAQSRHLLNRAGGVLDLPEASSASDTEEESAEMLEVGAHPLEEVVWSNASELVVGTVEHSRNLLARCAEIMGDASWGGSSNSAGDDRPAE